MHWYLVHTKPRQEICALDNLQRQGYECYLPLLKTEKLRHGAVAVLDEPLFPRYLFIRLGHGEGCKSWTPIRSTKGVNCLVRFGMEPAQVDDALIDALQMQEAAGRHSPERMYERGESVLVTEAPFAGLEGIFQMCDGDRRVIVLIEIMSKPVAIHVAPVSLRKIG